jgi:beta-glucosidase
MVGWSLALVDLQLAEGGEARLAEARQHALLDWIEPSREDDFIGVQTYSRERIGPTGAVPVPDGTPTMQTGWEVYPSALGNSVRIAAQHGEGAGACHGEWDGDRRRPGAHRIHPLGFGGSRPMHQ